MTKVREDKRALLKARLIEAAETQLQEKGLAGLNARDVTARAGCALGGLYTVMQDLDMLIMHVNSRTLERLGTELKAALPEGEVSPEKSMQALAATYTDFAIQNRNLWLALFEHRLPEGREIPDWHKQDHAVLIEVILPPLARIRPDLDPRAQAMRARTIFAAVHGVVHMALQGRFVGVPMDMLKSEVAALVATLVRGSAEVEPQPS